ncbi:hypothetical protein ACOI1A_00860 [Corynebacterium glutamicum]|uniref:hypothetical protein n=1 Tax=Corynebacterium glutamicum TaxID=1718 RepID=UPI003B595E27
MTDVIARAQELVEVRKNVDRENLGEVLTAVSYEAQFTPTLIESLAEEGYEYTAQVFMNQHWVFMWSPRTGNSVDGKWHPTRELAEKFAEQWQLDYPIRVVRRRVSPVEVVDD